MSTWNDNYAAPAYAVLHPAKTTPAGEKTVAAGHEATLSSALGVRPCGGHPLVLIGGAGRVWDVFIRMR